MCAADSSLIATYGYDPEKLLLRIAFHQGGMWDYRGLTMERFLEFVRSESKGKHFLREIKGKYDAEKIA